MGYVFVDGYNVINSWPELDRIKKYSFESARTKLIEMIQNYAAYKGCKVFIVFDAHLVSGSLEKKEKLGNIIIVFTKEGETADSYIEKFVNSIGRKAEVCVVTSDSLEQQLVFQRGAVRMSSLEFYNEVVETSHKINQKIRKSISKSRDLLEDRVDEDILEKLRRIRRGD